MLELGFKVFISYLCGSLNGALLVGQLYGGIDIRKVGSGNAGGTNALRTQGKLFGFLVLAIDLVKGILPVLVLPGLAWPVPIDPQISREWITFACGGAAVPPQVINEACEALDNCRAFRVYGSTEAPIITLGFVGDVDQFRHADGAALGDPADPIGFVGADRPMQSNAGIVRKLRIILVIW